MGKIMKNGIQYGVGGIQKAEGITYDNTDSGMTATNVQGAVDELNNSLNNSGNAYIKLPDGTAFAWGRVKFGTASTTGTKTATVNFPITFTAKPAAVVSWYDTEHVFEYFGDVSVYNTSLSASTFAAVTNQIKVSNYDWYACYIAVGRWK